MSEGRKRMCLEESLILLFPSLVQEMLVSLMSHEDLLLLRLLLRQRKVLGPSLWLLRNLLLLPLNLRLELSLIMLLQLLDLRRRKIQPNQNCRFRKCSKWMFPRDPLLDLIHLLALSLGRLYWRRRNMKVLLLLRLNLQSPSLMLLLLLRRSLLLVLVEKEVNEEDVDVDVQGTHPEESPAQEDGMQNLNLNQSLLLSLSLQSLGSLVLSLPRM
jgi:hypothetical protein